MCGAFALTIGRYRADLTFSRPFSVFRYVGLTLTSYNSLGMGNETLKLGRCALKTNFTCGPSGVQGINWVNNALMKPICQQYGTALNVRLVADIDINHAPRALPFVLPSVRTLGWAPLLPLPHVPVAY